jgi:hypothetical protein
MCQFIWTRTQYHLCLGQTCEGRVAELGNSDVEHLCNLDPVALEEYKHLGMPDHSCQRMVSESGFALGLALVSPQLFGAAHSRTFQ